MMDEDMETYFKQTIDVLEALEGTVRDMRQNLEWKVRDSMIQRVKAAA